MQKDLLPAIELMYFAYRGFTEGPDNLLAARGLNRLHHRVLYFVARNPGLSVSELLQILKISKQALNLPMRQLVEAGLVSNGRSAADRRRRELDLTRKGARLEMQLTRIQTRQLERIVEQVGPQAMRGWSRVMSGFAGPDPATESDD